MWWLQSKIVKVISSVLGIVFLSINTYAQFVTVKNPILNAYFCSDFSNAMNVGCTQLDTVKAESLYTNIYKIQQSGKGISNADEVLFFKNVDTIYLNNNNLTSFPTDISRLRSLVRLNLAANQLTVAPSIRYTNAVSGDTAVKLVYLQANKISVLPASWYTPNLITQVIDLRSNELTGIPTFQDYPEIRRLNVAENHLDFEDLIPVKLNPRWLTSQFDLFPQKAFYIANQELDPGDNVFIQAPGTVLPTNTYSLLKDGVEIEVSTSGTFSISNIQPEQAGWYTIQVRNSNFPNASDYLESVPFYLDVRVITKKNVVTFSPNGDGVADVVFIDGNGTAKIINKGGIEVHTISLPYEWDGKDKYGNNLEPGIYYISKSDGSVLKALLVN